MTPTLKIILGIVFLGALGSTAWFLHTPRATESPVATTTPETSGATTTATVTTTSTTTTTAKPTKPPIVQPPATHTLAISSISPNSGPVGTTVTLTGSGFTKSSQVMVGTNAAIANVSVNSADTTLSFTMPDSAGAYCTAGRACPMYLMLIRPGTYSLSVRNTDGGNSNSVSYTLTGESAF